VIVRFVDIVRIVDHHCLDVLFITHQYLVETIKASPHILNTIIVDE